MTDPQLQRISTLAARCRTMEEDLTIARSMLNAAIKNAQGVSQSAIARAAGVSRQRISHVLAEKP